METYTPPFDSVADDDLMDTLKVRVYYLDDYAAYWLRLVAQCGTALREQCDAALRERNEMCVQVRKQLDTY